MPAIVTERPYSLSFVIPATGHCQVHRLSPRRRGCHEHSRHTAVRLVTSPPLRICTGLRVRSEQQRAVPRPEGEWLPLVANVRAHTGLAVMHAGRISTPEMAEEALASGAIDIACMTKSHICDPHFTIKVRDNRLDDIRYCTRCLQSCHGK